MNIRQSSLYAKFLEQIGWQVKKVCGFNIFIKHIPLFGKIAKLQRVKKPLPFAEIEKFIRIEKIKRIIIEPDELPDNLLETQFLAHGYKINNSPFIPTKTILIDLIPSEENIFNSFSQAKRRAIRKALKNNIKIRESTDIESFINLKIGYFPLFGFLLKHEFRALWQTFYPQNATLLTASCSLDLDHCNKPLAGVLLLFHQKKAYSKSAKPRPCVEDETLSITARSAHKAEQESTSTSKVDSYYWLAASNKEGNAFAVPSLLVWEALKLAKKRGVTSFDFEGIYDSRFHSSTKNWQGFTKFKQGFGGREITYLGSFTK